MTDPIIPSPVWPWPKLSNDLSWPPNPHPQFIVARKAEADPPEKAVFFDRMGRSVESPFPLARKSAEMDAAQEREETAKMMRGMALGIDAAENGAIRFDYSRPIYTPPRPRPINRRQLVKRLRARFGG